MYDCNKKNRPGELATPERNNYFYGKLLNERSLRMEQSYFNDKRWMINRAGLGSGVVCGLSVAIQGQFLCIAPGLALDPQGREIVVPSGFLADPWKVTDANGGIAQELSRNQDHDVYICIGYRECPGDYVPVLVTDCDNSNQQAASTISESFCIYVKVGSPPLRPTLPDPALCEALTTPADANAKQLAICEVVSSRPCAEGREDACIVLAAVKLKADGTIDPAIDICGARPLVYSNPELFEMLMCLSERGGEGTQGSTGPMGPAGPGIDLVEREDRLCTEAPTVRIEGASPNRTLYLGIPPGCDGAPGPEGAGISQVVVNQLPCKELPSAKLEPDPTHSPHQILTLGIPGHCDQSLTKITEISWKHDGEMKAQDFFNDGLKITFSAPVTATNSQAIAESVNGWFQVSAEVWGGEVNRGTLMLALANPRVLSWWVASGLSLGSPGSLPVIRLHGAMRLAAHEAFFEPQGMPYDIVGPPHNLYSPSFYMTLYWLNRLFADAQGITNLQIAIRVTLLTDFLIDGNKKAVDGNYIGGTLPTGNGVQGGNFESWFRLTDITEMILPTTAVEAELGRHALADMLPSLAELDELFKI